MKNYLQTFLLTLAILLGFQSAAAYDWYIVGGSYGWGKTGVQFKATTDADIYEAYLENAKLNENGGFRIKCGSNFSGNPDWQYSLCGEGPLKLDEPVTFVYQDDDNKGVDGNTYGNTQLDSDEAFTGYIRITVPDPTISSNQPTVLLTTEAYSSGDTPLPPTPGEKVDWYLVGNQWGGWDNMSDATRQFEEYDDNDGNPIYRLRMTQAINADDWFKFRQKNDSGEIGYDGNFTPGTDWVDCSEKSKNFTLAEAITPVIYICPSKNKVIICANNNYVLPVTPAVPDWRIEFSDGTTDYIPMAKYNGRYVDNDGNGHDIYYAQLSAATSSFYFKSSGDPEIYAENSDVMLTDNDSWELFGDYPVNTSKAYFTCPAGMLYICPDLNYVAFDANSTFDPTDNPNRPKQEVVFFGGAASEDITKVELHLTTASGSEYVTLWNVGESYWLDREGFYAGKIDVIKYTGIQDVRITLKDGSKHYQGRDGREGNLVTGLYKAPAVGAGIESPWYEYIISQIDRNQGEGDNGLSTYSTYCTPERYAALVASDDNKNRVLIFGESADVYVPKNDINDTNYVWKPLTWDWNEFISFTGEGNNVGYRRVPLFNGVNAIQIKISSAAKFKLGWIPVVDLYNEAATGTEIEDKRAWVTLDLGLIGAPVTETSGTMPEGTLEYRKPKRYNLYSQANWVVDEEANNKTAYLVIDTDKEYKSVTMVSFEPKTLLSEFSVEYRRLALDKENLQDGTVEKEYALKGSTADGYAYPDVLNELTGTVELTPSYLVGGLDPTIQTEIRENYQRVFHFYNCKCEYLAGSTATAAGAHSDDKEIGTYDTKKFGEDGYQPLYGKTKFSLRNIATEDVPQLMVQTDYKYLKYGTDEAGANAAPGFRTVPEGIALKSTSAEEKYTTVKPVLDDEYSMLFTYAEGSRTGWGLQMIVPFAEEEGTTTELVAYPAFEASCNGQSEVEPAHEGMTDVFQENHYNWPIIGYTPAGDLASDDYDHNVHNWSKFCDKYKLLDFVIHSVGSDNKAVENATTLDGVEVTLHFAYPFVKYVDAQIKKVEDNTPAAAPARVNLVADATELPKVGESYTIDYKYATDTKIYKSGENGGVITGVENISVTGEDAQPEYYNLQGLKVSEPLAPGVYIVRCGAKTYKRLVK